MIFQATSKCRLHKAAQTFSRRAFVIHWICHIYGGNTYNELRSQDMQKIVDECENRSTGVGFFRTGTTENWRRKRVKNVETHKHNHNKKELHSICLLWGRYFILLVIISAFCVCFCPKQQRSRCWFVFLILFFKSTLR